MKLIKLLVLTLIISSCESSTTEKIQYCNYYGSHVHHFTGEFKPKVNSHSFSSNIQAKKVVEDILKQVGLQRNFEIEQYDNIDNAAAVIIDKKRYILYNNEFMNIADNITGNKWTAISILAHEVGHHLQGHTLESEGSRPAKELEADKFSGFILAKLGASLGDAQEAVMSLVPEKGSNTHPPRSKRLLAIADGFSESVIKTKKLTSELDEEIFDQKDIEISKQKPRVNSIDEYASYFQKIYESDGSYKSFEMDNFIFKTNSRRVKSFDNGQFRGLSKALKGNQEMKVQINVFGKNMDLANGRAQSVYNMLIALGNEKKQISYKGINSIDEKVVIKIK